MNPTFCRSVGEPASSSNKLSGALPSNLAERFLFFPAIWGLSVDFKN